MIVAAPITEGLRSSGFHWDAWLLSALSLVNGYPYQTEFATRNDLPALVLAPTGCGKAAVVVLGWLNRRSIGFCVEEGGPAYRVRRLRGGSLR